MTMIAWGNTINLACNNCHHPLYEQYQISPNYSSNYRNYFNILLLNYSCMHCWESLPYAMPTSTIQEFYKELSYLILTNQIYFTEVILKDFQKLYDAALHISHRSDLY